ncbi:MAG: hypothetical protein MNSN_04940 [Minisyncoccus archaeiphilus]|uniref:hypothetical protein n=1 Tax=Minisyncoccus archaeiphilus TaxID=3238481 RepID=UPI002B1A1AD2|nr:MAG: hypothetical protein MNSN_04940 [Candidatus Parcubacteria bacterium]
MSKNEADGVKKISISFLKKNGYLKGWRSGTITWTSGYDEHKSSVGIEVSTVSSDSYLRINYTQTDNYSGEKKDFDYKIPLTTTPCRFGGKRYWFVCPWYKNGVYCGRRVGTLYKDGDYFACRHCYDLTYASKNVNRRYKMFPLFNVLTIEQKIEELEKSIKCRYYNGKPTKKQKRLDLLYKDLELNYNKSKKFKLDF